MSKLNDKLLKTVKPQVAKKGFRKSFWREYRARAAAGSDVGKVLNALEGYGVTAAGNADKVDVIQLKVVVALFDTLTKSFKTAKGKCGKAQSHTKDFCDAYLSAIPKCKQAAQKRLDDIEKAKKAEEKAAADQEKKAKELAAFTKAAAPIDKELDNAIKVAGEIMTGANAANTAISNVHSKWLSSYKAGEPDAASKTKQAMAAAAAALKKHKLNTLSQTAKQLAFDIKNLQKKLKGLGSPAGSEKSRKAMTTKLTDLVAKYKNASGATIAAVKTYNFAVNEMKQSAMEGA